MKALSLIPIAFIYAGASIVIFFGAFTTDPFSIFSMLYAWAFVIFPTFIIPGYFIYNQVRHKRWGWTRVVVGSLMIVGVSFCHISLIAAASAAV